MDLEAKSNLELEKIQALKQLEVARTKLEILDSDTQPSNFDTLPKDGMNKLLDKYMGLYNVPEINHLNSATVSVVNTGLINSPQNESSIQTFTPYNMSNGVKPKSSTHLDPSSPVFVPTNPATISDQQMYSIQMPQSVVSSCPTQSTVCTQFTEPVMSTRQPCPLSLLCLFSLLCLQSLLCLFSQPCPLSLLCLFSLFCLLSL